MLKPTLVLGASLKPNRYSHIAIHRLKNYGHPVRAIGLVAGTVAGVPLETFEKVEANPSLLKPTATDDPKGVEDMSRPIDTVTLYLNPKRQQPYYSMIINLAPKRVIFNPGTENPEFYRLLGKANISYEIACTLVLLASNQY